jgi:hypothetical protein
VQVFPHDDFIDDEPIEAYDDEEEEEVNGEEITQDDAYAPFDDAEAPFIMDADFVPDEVLTLFVASVHSPFASPPKRRRKTRKRRTRRAKKPSILRPITLKERTRRSSFYILQSDVFSPCLKVVDQFLDEYYGLDFDDIVAGMPTRFRYRQVAANDFGLSAEEVCLFHILATSPHVL